MENFWMKLLFTYVNKNFHLSDSTIGVGSLEKGRSGVGHCKHIFESFAGKRSGQIEGLPEVDEKDQLHLFFLKME
jgi:hypothetical protein